jgi:acyl carrier protein
MNAEPETLAVVTELIQEVIGEDWALDEPITRATSFSEDLELESIEFVVLAEKLQERYGEQVDFVSWLSAKELDDIIALKVGDLVDFLDRCHA